MCVVACETRLLMCGEDGVGVTTDGTYVESDAEVGDEDDGET